MLISELIKKDEQLQKDLEDRDCCGLCATHEAAYRQLEKVLYCPHCGKPVEVTKGQDWGDLIEFDKYAPVGDWYADPDEEIRMWPIIRCEHCGDEFALTPMRVIHNYNHDVYYTGKKHILPKFSHKELVDILIPNIQNYLDRYETEHNLNAWNLATWCAHDIEAYVSTLIQDNYKEVK